MQSPRPLASTLYTTLLGGLCLCGIVGCASSPLDGLSGLRNGSSTDVASGTARPTSSMDEYRLRSELAALLSADPARSLRAERQLRGLNESERLRLLQVARERPTERDPRWLSLMEDLHGPVKLSPTDEWRYLSWRVSQSDRARAMRAQSRLVDLAHAHPDTLLEVVRRKEAGYESAVLALAAARHPQAIHEFVASYRSPTSPSERRIMAEALAMWTGDRVVPRVVGQPWEIEADAAQVTTMVAQLTPVPAVPESKTVSPGAHDPLRPGSASDPWIGTLVPPAGASPVFPEPGGPPSEAPSGGTPHGR